MSQIFLLSYYPWITQHKTPEEIRQNIDIFAKALGEKLSTREAVTIQVQNPFEVPQQIDAIVNGQTHIALMNPLGFAVAMTQNPNVTASVVALRVIDGQVGDHYFAQIYTHVDQHVNNLSELRKKRMGYGSVISTSNFIIPAFDLKQNKVHPFAGFHSTEFVGGHDTVTAAVYHQTIDAGAGHDGVIVDLSKQPGFEDAMQKLVTLHRSDPIPSDPIAVNIPDADARDAVQQALVDISQEADVKAAIAEFWGEAKGLQKTSAKPYAYLLNAVQSLGLTTEDLFS